MDKNKEIVVYRIHCNVNGKDYIGITTDLKRRKIGHYNKDTFIGRAIRKYKKENFTWTILERPKTWELACSMEQFYIDYLNTKEPNGYNLTDGGEGTPGWKMPDRMRINKSESMKGEKHHNWGKKLPEETRKKISESHKGKKLSEEHKKKLAITSSKIKHSEETKKKISENNIGKHSHQLLGRKHSEESKMKMSKAKRGKPMSESTKKKLSIINTGNILSKETRQKISDKVGGEKHPNWGKHHSEEMKKKISETLKGQCSGDKNPSAKLNESIVLEIRARFDSENITKTQLSKEYNISVSTISSLILRKTWAHI